MSNVFRGGLPYAVDKKRLAEAYPVEKLVEGLMIEHEQLEGILGYERGSQRYYGVVNSWISERKNSDGIIMVWQPSIGIKVINPSEILNYAETKTRQKIRQTGIAVKIFAWVDRLRLNPAGQARLDHQMLIAQRIKGALSAANKELAVDIAPVKSLPKPKLVRDEKAS